MCFRVGSGFDFHRLSPNLPLILGGILIPHNSGLEGHSDADVILHAISDAMLGAAGLPDLGSHFPDTNPKYKDISSQILLKKVFCLVQETGLRLSNLDVTVIAEQPKLSPYVQTIKDNLAQLLKINKSRIGIKATTMELTGPIGRGEGIAAQAVVLLVKEETTT